MGLIDRIATNAHIKLLPDGNDTTAIVGLLFNPSQLGEVLWECVTEQAESKDFSRQQFIDALDGDALAGGFGALQDAIVFFTPKSTRDAMRIALEKQMIAIEHGGAMVARVAKSETTDQAIKKQLERIEEELTANLKTFDASALN